ncbi:MAG: hypothetical protein HPZ91_07900 [Lentisphaeria bacterium]|nr:hypothetical protein [Lentisphaeria bacterium]
MNKTGICVLTAFASLAAFSAGAENLNRLPGTKLTADSQYSVYAPANAADGGCTEMKSRWVSSAVPVDHWLMAEYDSPRTVNAVTLVFWADTHVSVDFDIEGRTGGEWKLLRSVRGNRAVAPRFIFPRAEVDALRVVFRRQMPDAMVRLYEFEAENAPAAMEFAVSPTHGNGFLAKGEKRSVTLRSFEEKPVAVTLKTVLRPQPGTPGREIVRTLNLTLSGVAEIPLPVPETYGSYEYDFRLTAKDGKELVSGSESFFYFPPSLPVYRTASPFAAHYYHMHDALVDYAGLSWWRNHDVYGRWNNNSDAKGNADWSELDDRLANVKRNRIRECAVLLGAPRKYSTILPGEPAASAKDSVYSYYPPADLDAWRESYLKPLAERVAKASPFRVYEIWNEAWSYYRLRGLRGTPGEAMQLFRESYETMKKADPDALVYPTDTGAALIDSPYSFPGFGQDMFDLGCLRWADLMSYHSYGMMDYNRLERYRRNMWNYGRDLEMWSTETAASGQPFHRLMESLLSHRIWGNGKTFIYNGSKWAPLYLDGKPHMNLVAMAAMIRELGDAVPLGWEEKGDVTTYLFANGGTPVAVLFSKSGKPVRIDLPLTGKSVVADVFGNTLDPKTAILSVESPVFVRNPASAAIARLAAAQLAFYAGHVKPEGKLLDALARKIAGTGPEALPETVRKEYARISKLRRPMHGEALYESNLALDALTNLQLLFDRATGNVPSAPMPVAELRKAVGVQWEAVRAKTQENGVLPDTERLTSRAQKELQYAMQYDSDGDAAARNIWLERAAADLAEAQARTATEEMAALYKTKSYFRSHKPLIRSLMFTFPAGKPQEAVITLANPTGTARRGTLAVALPEGWSIDRSEIAYDVPPLSRRFYTVRLTAPAKFTDEWRGKIKVADRDGNFPEIKADCRIVTKVPAYPVLGGAISSGEFTGN